MTTAHAGDPDEYKACLDNQDEPDDRRGARGAVLAACVNQNTWTPTVDTYNDPNAWRISQDEAQCRQLASQASGGGSVRKTAEGVGIGGLLGAAAGAAIGAVAGAPGRRCDRRDRGRLRRRYLRGDGEQ